jgi:hypothetical protein
MIRTNNVVSLAVWRQRQLRKSLSTDAVLYEKALIERFDELCATPEDVEVAYELIRGRLVADYMEKHLDEVKVAVLARRALREKASAPGVVVPFRSA